MKTTTKRGYAKINLHLDITGIREDGFHTVNNVMQTVTLYDTVTVTLRADGEYTVDCNNPSVPQNASNLAIKAAVAFEKELGTAYGADIYVDKQIPMAAGLAGGSADAAAVLKAMNELCGNPFTVQKLCEIGSGLGSDVPFCIACGSAFADGKGDILHPFPSMPDCIMVIACGGEGVSTPKAFSMLDERYDKFCHYTPKSLVELKAALDEKDIKKIVASTFNIFEEPILSLRPVASAIKSAMLETDALGAMMSGSGPSVFGIFANEQDALSACQKIKDLGVIPHICRPTTHENID